MEFVVKTVWTDNITSKEIEDFIYAHRTTFGSHYDRAYFNYKYLQNPYGPSLIVLAYTNDSIIAAARAFWRNDVNGIKAFQAVDTCTIPSFQRLGLFKITTEAALNELPKDSFIYNFPNARSKPQYMKYGWIIQKECYNRIFNPFIYRNENKTSIDKTYLNWWIKFRLSSKLAYVKIFGCYYLVRQMNGVKRFEIVGEINKESSVGFPKAHPWILTYLSNHHSVYNNKKAVPFYVVSRNMKNEIDIPSWKVDAL